MSKKKIVVSKPTKDVELATPIALRVAWGMSANPRTGGVLVIETIDGTDGAHFADSFAFGSVADAVAFVERRRRQVRDAVERFKRELATMVSA